MRRSHTDRPFWSGCLGQIPVSEDSRWGGRLSEVAARGHILSYPHGHIRSLIEACERALAAPETVRREVYEYFNRCGTLGPLVAHQIAAFHAADVAAPRACAGAAWG